MLLWNVPGITAIKLADVVFLERANAYDAVVVTKTHFSLARPASQLVLLGFRPFAAMREGTGPWVHGDVTVSVTTTTSCAVARSRKTTSASVVAVIPCTSHSSTCKLAQLTRATMGRRCHALHHRALAGRHAASASSSDTVASMAALRRGGMTDWRGRAPS